MNIGNFTDKVIRAKYSTELAEKLISYRNNLAILGKVESNPKFSIGIGRDVYITKKKGSADFNVAVDNGSGNRVKIVKELKDPSNTHNFSFGNVVNTVNNGLTTEGISYTTELTLFYL